MATRVPTSRLELRPLPAAAAEALLNDRAEASRMLEAELPPEWPQHDLVDLLPAHVRVSIEDERFGVWVMIDRESRSVVGDIGFLGPPDDAGSVELGYSVLPELRRRRYATEAA